MFRGPEAGLEVLAAIEGDGRLAGLHRVAAVRGHILELAGDSPRAAAAYDRAATLTTSLPATIASAPGGCCPGLRGESAS
jgi:predicted RNA polymerase sigma factor